MKILFEGNIAYRRFWFSAEAHCYVQVFKGESNSLVIATEIPENQGMSVTNACEHIATLMQQKYHLNPVSMVFVEHYQPNGGLLRKTETFDNVTFTWKRLDKPSFYEASHPQWKRISSQELEDIKARLQETVIEKIRKLLALSKSCNPHEAALAASKAQELMLQYNLELSHIETVKSKYVKEMVSQKSRLIWRKRLLAAIARFNFCQTVECVGSGHCEIIGEPHNIAIVRTLYEYLETTIERLADEGLAKHLNYDRDDMTRSVYRQKNTPGYKRTWKNNFYHGAIDVLLYRLDEQQKQSIAEQEQSATNEMKALIVVKDHELKEAMERMYPNIKEVSRHSVTKDQPGWAAGVKAGSEIALNKQLEESYETSH